MIETNLSEFNPLRFEGENLKDKVYSVQIKDFEDIELAKQLLKSCVDLEKKIEDLRTSITKPVNEAIKKINNMAKEIALPVAEAKNTIKKKIVDFNEEQERIKKLEEQRIAGIIDNMSKILNKSLLDGFMKSLEEKDSKNFIIKTSYDRQILQIEEKERQEEEKRIREAEEKRLEEVKKQQSEEQAKITEEQIRIEREKRELESQKEKEQKEKELENKEIIVEKIQNTETDKIKGMRTKVMREIIDENEVPKSLCSPDSKKINEALKSGVIEIPGIKVWEEKTIQ